jgi:nucleoside-diphosphate-sugar epimerase
MKPQNQPGQHNHPLARDLDEILCRVGDLWHQFRGQRIFMTGATGFFGKWLLESLLWANQRLALDLHVLVLTRNAAPLLKALPHLATNDVIRFLNGDVRTFDFPEGKYETVIHMATTSAEATFGGEKPLEKFTTAAIGTQRVLEFAARCGATRFLLTSSGNAYGPIAKGSPPISEDHVGAPDIENPVSSALGEGKRAAELLARIYAENHGFEAKICRCFTFIGPYLQTDLHYAAGNFIRDAAAGKPIRVHGDGSPLRSFLYPTDLVVWLINLLFRAPSGRLYNIGSEETVSIGELAEAVARQSGNTVIIEGGRSIPSTASPDAYLPSIARITEELGLTRKVSLNDAIGRTLAFQKQTRL